VIQWPMSRSRSAGTGREPSSSGGAAPGRGRLGLRAVPAAPSRWSAPLGVWAGCGRRRRPQEEYGVSVIQWPMSRSPLVPVESQAALGGDRGGFDWACGPCQLLRAGRALCASGGYRPGGRESVFRVANSEVCGHRIYGSKTTNRSFDCIWLLSRSGIRLHLNWRRLR
jgi:hypothetical protein